LEKLKRVEDMSMIRRGMGRKAKSAFFAILLLAVCADEGCKGRGANTSGLERRVPVMVAAVEQKTVPVELSAIGNVEAYASVEIKAQAGGLLSGVYFKEGQDVNKGDMLFTIDPRPYQAQLSQAEANLARDSAQLDNAEVEAKRYQELLQKDLISREQYDQTRTNAEVLRATVMADKALVQNAKLMLSYCYIRAPVSGRTGSLLAHPGDLIKANDVNAMVVINQIRPIYVSFSLPEQYLAEVKKYFASGGIKVSAVIPNQSEKTEPELGDLTFIDNAVDTTTGTVRLKATFQNEKKGLWPGQYVEVSITLSMMPNAIVVPAQAVQEGQTGQYVYVVKPDMSVELRPVTSSSYQQLAVVEKGLKPGEVVVTDGQLGLFPGAKVEITNPAAPSN